MWGRAQCILQSCGQAFGPDVSVGGGIKRAPAVYILAAMYKLSPLTLRLNVYDWKAQLDFVFSFVNSWLNDRY